MFILLIFNFAQFSLQILLTSKLGNDTLITTRILGKGEEKDE